jgi:hypothetical protein
MADHHETKRFIFPNPSEAIITLELDSLSHTAQDFMTCGDKKE